MAAAKRTCYSGPHGAEIWKAREAPDVRVSFHDLAVFLAGAFMLVGRIAKRPVPHRQLAICCRDVHGDEGVTRIHGLRDKHTQALRVMGVFEPVPF